MNRTACLVTLSLLAFLSCARGIGPRRQILKGA